MNSQERSINNGALGDAASSQKISNRSLRFQVIENWADHGVQKNRSLFKAEKLYRACIQAIDGPIFRPIVVSFTDKYEINKKVSLLVDAFDFLPTRPDLSFDAIWRPFEQILKEKNGSNIASALDKLAKDESFSQTFDVLLADFPMQVCEYMYKQLTSSEDSEVGRRLAGNVTNFNCEELKRFIEHLSARFPPKDGDTRRKGARLLRRVLEGQSIELGHGCFVLSLSSRMFILLRCFLYNYRNSRFHGSLTSPFSSSTASLNTYLLPYFAVISVYVLLCILWSEKGLYSQHEIRANAEENYLIAKKLFCQQWDK